MYALCKRVPCGQVYKVNAVMGVNLLESITTVYSKRHVILCICLCVESQSRISSSSDKEDIISDTTVSKLPGMWTYSILVCLA